MKHTLSSILWSMVVAIAVTACSPNSQEVKCRKILEKVPADATLVVVGDAKTIIESTGGTAVGGSLTLPSYLVAQMSDKDREQMNEGLDKIGGSGIVMQECAVVMTELKQDPIFVMEYADEAKLIATLTESGLSPVPNSDGITIYSDEKAPVDENTYVALKDSYLYFCTKTCGNDNAHGDDGTKLLARFISDAARRPMSETPRAEYISKGNALGAVLQIPDDFRHQIARSAGNLPAEMLSLYDGSIMASCDLTQDDILLSVAFCDKEGHVRKWADVNTFDIDLNARISGEALRYLNSSENIVVASTCKGINWAKCFDMISKSLQNDRSIAATLPLMRSYCEKFDGTIALGFGFLNGLASFQNINYGTDPLHQFAATIVLETKPGEAQTILSDINGIIGTTGLPVVPSTNGFALDIPNVGSVYVECRDNFLIVSNCPISDAGGSPALRIVDFSAQREAFAANFPKDDQLMLELGIRYDAEWVVLNDETDVESTVRLSLKGGEPDPILAKIIKTVMLFAQK